jgi:hypothetical protein
VGRVPLKLDSVIVGLEGAVLLHPLNGLLAVLGKTGLPQWCAVRCAGLQGEQWHKQSETVFCQGSGRSCR